MSAGPPVRLSLAWGLGGGIVASLILIAPPLLGAAPGGRLADFGALAAGLLAVQLGLGASARPGAGFRERMQCATIIAATVSLTTGLGAYVLFAVLRPTLLADRYAAQQRALARSAPGTERITHELVSLAARKAQYLDPLFQALSSAGTLFFFGMLLGAYGAWRVHVASRLRPLPARPGASA
ncbi:MAG TPA: hypothetical protein VN790_09515 [Steroidobacteraceae bacterium]|nr:hypothetical protein [Steroidobacteraceae bacterium]